MDTKNEGAVRDEHLKKFVVVQVFGNNYHVLPREEYYENLRHLSEYIGDVRGLVRIITHFDGTEDLHKEHQQALEILKQVWEKHTAEHSGENWKPWDALVSDGSIALQVEAMELFADRRERERQGGLTVKDYEEVINGHNRLVKVIDDIINGTQAAGRPNLEDLVGDIIQLKKIEDVARKEKLLMPRLMRTMVKCECLCHSDKTLKGKHVVPCCKNGFVEIIEPAVRTFHELSVPWAKLLKDHMINNLWIDEKNADQVLSFIYKLMTP